MTAARYGGESGSSGHNADAIMRLPINRALGRVCKAAWGKSPGGTTKPAGAFHVWINPQSDVCPGRGCERANTAGVLVNLVPFDGGTHAVKSYFAYPSPRHRAAKKTKRKKM